MEPDYRIVFGNRHYYNRKPCSNDNIYSYRHRHKWMHKLNYCNSYRDASTSGRLYFATGKHRLRKFNFRNTYS